MTGSGCFNSPHEPFIACVREARHSLQDVANLRDAASRHLSMPHAVVCFSDQPEACEGVIFVDTSRMGLPGQWAKLLLFEPTWREFSPVIYFNLDVVIMRDLTPLVTVPGEFTTTLDQSVMIIGGGKAGFVWERFEKWRLDLMRCHTPRTCIEALYPRARRLRKSPVAHEQVTTRG